jgi:hypothetical protein
MYEIGNEHRQLSILAAGIAVFDRHVLSVDKTSFLKALPERRDKGVRFAGCGARVDEPYYRDSVFRECGKRPNDCRATKKCHKIAAEHVG